MILNSVYTPRFIKYYFHFKDYTIFEDSWFTDGDILKDCETGEICEYTDFKIFEDYVMEGSHGATISQRLIKRSAFKFKNKINGTKFIKIGKKIGNQEYLYGKN